MRFESEAGLRLDDPAPGELDEALARLDGVDNSYATLTSPDGRGYVQAGGGPDLFTVELREVYADGAFRHLKAARPDDRRDGAGERRLTIGGADVTVRADEAVDLAAVRHLFRAFLAGRATTAPVVWRDITAMFRDVP